MPRRGYSELYEAIQEAFDPEDMTEERLQSWLQHGDTGKHTIKWGKDKAGEQRYKEVIGGGVSSGTKRLAKRLSATSQIKNAIETAESTSDLDELYQEAKGLDVHSDALVEEINAKRTEFELAEGIAEKEIADAEVDRRIIESEIKQTKEEANEIESEIEASQEQKELLQEAKLADEAEELQRDINERKSELARIERERRDLEKQLKEQEEIIKESSGRSFKERHKRKRAKRAIKKIRERL